MKEARKILGVDRSTIGVLYRSDWSVAQISARLGISRMRVRNVLLQQGLPTQKSRLRPHRRRLPVPPQAPPASAPT